MNKVVLDTDILSAICLENRSEIVTNNRTHFSRIEGLTLQNWLSKGAPLD